jgi:hypothetical protein
VGRLTSHSASGIDSFAVVGEGGEMSLEEPALEPEHATAASDTATEQAMTVWSAPGALECTYAPPWGEMSGEVIARLFPIETVTHG